MSKLEEIYQRYKGETDKGTAHTYLGVYAMEWDLGRTGVFRVLEIGVQSGGSLRLWREYFTWGEIHGIDVNDCPSLAGEDRIVFHKVNVMDKEGVRKALGNTKFDIIIDDASHRLEEQLGAISILWKNLARGGWYVVEDVLNAGDLERFECFGASCSTYDQAKITGKHADRLVVIRKGVA